jgi:hypothetical protein
MRTRKNCTKCKIEKSISDFYFDKRVGRGYKTICSSCENAQKRMKRKLDWKLENQPISLFISAFRKRFGDHNNFSEEFIELYRNTIKLKATINNQKSKIVMLKENLVCKGCGAVQPLDLPMEVKKLAVAGELFTRLHEKC